MKVHYNAEQIQLEPQAILEFLTQYLQLPSLNGIAVAINDALIPKQEWENTLIQENDSILVIRAGQGG